MSESTPPNARKGLDFDVLLQLVGRERTLILSFFAVVVLGAAIGTMLTVRKYKAVAVVQLLPRAGQELETKEVVRNDDGGYMETRDRARTQIQIMLSRSIREAVVRADIKLGHDEFNLTSASLDALAKLVTAGPREDTQLVEIAVVHPDPERAAALANLFADVYTSSNLSSRTDAARETQGWLGGQSSSATGALASATARIMAFKEQHDVVDIEERVDGISSQMAALQIALGEATTKRTLLEGNVRQHRRLLEKGDLEVLASMFTDSTLDSMIKDRAKILTETADVLSRYGEQHPEHQRAVERIKRVEALIAVEVQRNVDAEVSEVRALRGQEAGINRELERVKGELLEKQRLKSEFDTIKGEEDRARWLEQALAQRSAEVDLQASSRLNDVRVVDRAVPPTRPTSPNLLLNLVVAAAVGIGGGLGLALVRHRFDDTVRDPLDVERQLDTRLLGVLPHLDIATVKERAFYPFEHPRSQAAEAVRGVRGLLQVGATTPGRLCLLVTSCEADEGKTHTAVQIAVSFAQLGFKVLLVDADLRCPQVHDVFGVPEAPGLAEAVDPACTDHRYLALTVVPNLALMTRGSPVEYPNELLSSAELSRLLTRLRATYDVVILDTPPASVVTDALTLAPIVDGVVVVVRQGKVPGRQVQEVLFRLRQMGGRVVGVVMNDVPPVRSASKYYDDTARKQPAKSA